jgi:hypothetical protein
MRHLLSSERHDRADRRRLQEARATVAAFSTAHPGEARQNKNLIAVES